MNSGVLDACLTRPVPKTECLALMREHVKSLGVVLSLLFWSCPSAILRAVVAITIAAIKSHAGRSLAHVGKEILKTLPAFTYGNPLVKVGSLCAGCCSSASTDHSSPDAVSGRFRSSVCGTAYSRNFVSKTTARSRLGRQKKLRGDLCSLSALTLAKVNAEAITSNNKLFDNAKAPKDLAKCDMSTHSASLTSTSECMVGYTQRRLFS